MSLLKKLKKAKERLPAPAIPKGVLRQQAALELSEAKRNKKPKFTTQQAKELTDRQYNNVFRLSSASYVLLQRYAESLDNLIELRRITGYEMTKEDALEIYYYEKIVEAITLGDEHLRKHHLLVEDGTCGMDNLHHLFFEILSQMEKMSERSLEIFKKVGETINSDKRFMWLDSESAFKDNMEIAIQYGMDLANKNKRKKATPKDVNLFLEQNSKQSQINKT